MQVFYERCCGLDIHKKSVTACLSISSAKGKINKQTRSFGTTTPELLQLLDWLVTAQCTHVAMESTGSYWKPIYNLLEGALELLVVNAHHIKNVPGRKTDVQDAEWIADLLRHGLLRSSFIPSRSMPELRELVRYRISLVQQRAAEVNRLQKVLEGANIKLSSVATDIMGVSGRAILGQIVAGNCDPQAMAELAKGRLRLKLPQLKQALAGRVQPHQRFMLAQLLAHIDFLDEALQQCICEIEARMYTSEEDLERLCTIPGIKRRTAELLLAEIGADMSRFPTHKHLASWAGLCPGNHESAGKRYSGKTRKGSRWLRAGLVEAAKAAGRTRTTYLGTHYRRLVARKGSKKASVAVAHTILVIAYHLLKHKTTYQELGANYFDQQDKERISRRLTKRLEQLGYQVFLEPQSTSLTPA
ncbi:MAG: IS110 family transposase [Gloeocapsa sp. UFS-A4-WI-NPMV-4B04]|nr:IS110 family transposase [Gloeocapsa sp. UFS-A4-WI-NPMV-4B04]